jgi:hypothetical protein
MDTHILRTTVFVKKTLETALSCWRDLAHSAASALRQISDSVHLRSFLGRSTPRQPLTVGPNARDAVVKGDLAPAGKTARHGVHQKASRSKTGRGQVKANREAIERGENEGMMVPSEHMMAPRRESGTAS